MAISGIVGQGVSTQAARGFLQNVSGLAGRVIGIYQNKYLAAAALGVTMFVLICTINKEAPKIVESKLVKNVSKNFFEKGSDKYNLSREALTWMSASLIMVVGTLGVSKLLQLPFSRATTLALAGWSLFANSVYVYNPISPDRSEARYVVDDGGRDQGSWRAEDAFKGDRHSGASSEHSRFEDSSDSDGDGDGETTFNWQTRRRNPPTEVQVVDESLLHTLTSQYNSTRFSQDNEDN